MRQLSIFIDESGDFGKIDNSSPYYLVSMLFHEQDNDINLEIEKLDKSLENCVFHDKEIHTGPIIRRESPYQDLTIDERRQILFKMRNFLNSCHLSQHTFMVNKRESGDKYNLSAKLIRQMSIFIKGHLEWFFGFNEVIVYYDHGQDELNLVINTVLNMELTNVSFRNISPIEYRLSQAVDYVCTMELLNLKLNEKRLSSSESSFFYKSQELKKSFIKPVLKMRI